jgi:transcriptional regulator with GAF, ATPase, and Fis domain
MNRTRKLIQERNRLIGEAAGVFKDLIGVSSSWERVLEALRLVAGSSVPVLLLGETGTGKEQVARKLHQLSERAAEAFVAVNCSALVPSLAESELFGHERGSFSGAVGTRRGRFEMADGGTLFLDEVGDLPVELQPKLLRVLQDGVFERVGGEKSLTVDVRIIAATNINLERAVRDGKFREDLLYRLNVFPIFLPPLRDRGEDAALLAEYFVSLIRKRPGFENTALSKSAVIKIIALPWRGNVRELRNVIERAAILSRGGLIEEDHVFPGMTACVSENEPQAPEHEPPAAPHGADHVPLSLEEVQRTHITQVLERCGGKIYGPKGAAALLKIKPTTLQSRMLKLGIRGA